MRDMNSISYTTCHANLNEAPVHPASPFRMPSRVALSPCVVIGRESPPGMLDCENPLGKKVSQPASQPASQSSMLVFQPRTAQPFPKRRECYMQLALQHVRSESSSLQYIHTVYTGYMHLLVLYPLRAELTILGSTIAHCPTYTTIWHSVPIKTLSRFFFFLNNAGPTSTLIRWSLLGCSKTEKPKNRRSQKSAKQCIPLSYIKNPTHGIVQ